jgi:hypothetical protein
MSESYAMTREKPLGVHQRHEKVPRQTLGGKTGPCVTASKEIWTLVVIPQETAFG